MSRNKYDALVTTIGQQPAPGMLDARLRFKYVRFDADGLPRFGELAKCLADHVVTYCLSARRRGAPTTPDEWGRLHREARHLLRRAEASGEAGEILLYFLIEAVLEAPQLVAKIELKTNPRLEVNGSDGVHFRWDGATSTLELFFGEAKLEKDVKSALKNARDSISRFHSKGLLSHELGLVTSHFKIADEALQKEVLSYLAPFSKTQRYRVNHACLIGFSWDEYKRFHSPAEKAEIERQFVEEYRKYSAELGELLQEAFEGQIPPYHLEVFFVPFDDVASFRAAFLEAVS